LQTAFNKTYANSSEEAKAFQNAKTNLIAIDEINLAFVEGKLGFTARPNPMLDKSKAFLIERRTGFRLPTSNVLQQFPAPSVNARSFGGRQLSVSLPPSLDYRDLGWVNPVLDQGFQCSSCYSFSACGALEGAVFNKTGRLFKCSEQNLIDCNKNDKTGNWGCHVS